MDNKRLKLPIGIQTFEEIRLDGYVYVDKTKYLVNLIDTGKIYFLARPRRFGKSLTVSALEALFSGKKELFKGLYAEAFVHRSDFRPSPVIRMDMSKISTDCGIDGLKQSLRQITIEMAETLEVDVPHDLPAGDILRNVIAKAAKKWNQKVVILVDEYDKPYTDFVNDPNMANDIRNILRNYYIQIKANDEYIRFTFITGISKFAKFGVFSTLNTPLDISMMPEFAQICGYTEEEIVHCFPDYLAETANKMQLCTPALIEMMRHYYNGFSFDNEAKIRLYNPYSTLSFLRSRDFANHWIETGNSKLIADYMKSRSLTVAQFRGLPVSKDFARSPGDMDATPPEGFLYQSGYLTLRPGSSDDFSLDYPNTEVLNAMSEMVTRNLLQYKDENYSQCRGDLLTGIQTKDKNKVMAVFNRLLSSVPYDDYAAAAKQGLSNIPYEMKPQEWLYRASILSFLQGCGVIVAGEMHTGKGRSDLVISHKNIIWVIEIKVAYQGESADKKAREAYRQIIEKSYAIPYPDAVCVGFGIDDAARQITHSVYNSLNYTS